MLFQNQQACQGVFSCFCLTVSKHVYPSKRGFNYPDDLTLKSHVSYSFTRYILLFARYEIIKFIPYCNNKFTMVCIKCRNSSSTQYPANFRKINKNKQLNFLSLATYKNTHTPWGLVLIRIIYTLIRN